jgi:antitoxin (DNA-binding transcriptional repressor) of toxin-antitoxin stability system
MDSNCVRSGLHPPQVREIAATHDTVAAYPRTSYNSHMEKASVSKLKDHLSAYLRKVRAGHSVIIYDRDVPIARLERIESSAQGSARLALLCAQGVTRPPQRQRSAASMRAAVSNLLPRSGRLLDAVQLDRAEDR